MSTTKWLFFLAWTALACQSKETQVEKSPDPYQNPVKIQFAAADQLTVTGLLYPLKESRASIILCHQAGANKVEYTRIAPQLQALGYQCLAIDQRAGNALLDFPNETRDFAVEHNVKADFPDAENDILGAINYMHKTYGDPIILWGSSYSASLVLAVANKNDLVNAVVSFSPAQYTELGENYSLADSISGLSKPTFVSSSKSEADEQQAQLLGNLDQHSLDHFIPEGDGGHGSASLWRTRPGHEEYWNAVEAFLSKYFSSI